MSALFLVFVAKIYKSNTFFILLIKTDNNTCTPRPPAVIMISDLEWIFLLQTDLGFFSAAATMSWMRISISSLTKSPERVLWFYVPLGPCNLDEDHSITWSNKPRPICTPCCGLGLVWDLGWKKLDILCYKAHFVWLKFESEYQQGISQTVRQIRFYPV